MQVTMTLVPRDEPASQEFEISISSQCGFTVQQSCPRPSQSSDQAVRGELM